MKIGYKILKKRRIHNRILFFLAICLSCFSIKAQDINAIKNSPDYVWGEGWGNTLSGATEHALSDLVSKIVVTVQSSFTLTEKELTQNGKIDSKSAVKNVVNSYSQATLNNTGRIVLKQEPDAQVLIYIKKNEIDRIFESRKQKVLNMVDMAVKAESNAKIDDALRYYYWSFCLLKSLRYPAEVKYNSASGSPLLITWIPSQIDEILNNITVANAVQDGLSVDFSILYKDKPVTSIDYTFFDGVDWSNTYSAKDGRGVLDLRPGVSASSIQLKCEYEFASESHIDRELEEVMKIFKGTSFRDAYKKLNSVAASAPALNSNPNNLLSSTPLSTKVDDSPSQASTMAIEPIKDCSTYNDIINQVIAAIKSRNYDSVNSFFTADGVEMFGKLVKYGNARILPASTIKFFKEGDNVVCRSVPMSFSFNNNRRKFVEDVNFTFNKDKKIDCVAFGLDQKAADDIMSKGNWKEYARMLMLNFIENYKTAFALKRLDYIESIFDDNAMIITGKYVQRASGVIKDGNNYTNNRYVKLTRQGKKDYMRNLKICFASNEFINIRFSQNDIMKCGDGEIYGIQIKQDYYSSSYGDSGYLFLMVDLNNPKNPIIKVRTWQPQPDPNFGVIGAPHF